MPRRNSSHPQAKPLLGVRPCRKTWFRSEEHANAILEKIMKDPKPGRVPCRVYECPKCHGWHLTSLGLNDGR